MILTLGQIISRATEMAGGRTDWTPSDVSFYVAMAYDEVKSRAKYRATEALAYSSTTSGENRINLPTDFDYALGLTLSYPSGSTSSSAATLKITLTQVNTDIVDEQQPYSGIPRSYAIYNAWMELIPSPNSAYSLQLRYQSKAPTLVASTDTPVLDDRWHPAILYKTVELLEASRGNQQAELVARNRYLSYADSTPSDTALRQQARPGMAAGYRRSWNEIYPDRYSS